MRVPAEERVDRTFWLVDHDGQRYFPIRMPRKGEASRGLFRVSDAGNTIPDGREVETIAEVADLVVNHGFSVRAVPESDIRKSPNFLKLYARKIASYGSSEGGDVLAPDGYWQALSLALGSGGASWASSHRDRVRIVEKGEAHVMARFDAAKGWCGIGVCLEGVNAATAYEGLLANRAQVERIAGQALIWDANGGPVSKQVLAKLDCDPGDRSDWPRQHAWLAAHVPAFERLLELA